MSKCFRGACKRGPYDGQEWEYFAPAMPVVHRIGATMINGTYEFGGGVWRWNGPTIRIHPANNPNPEPAPARDQGE